MSSSSVHASQPYPQAFICTGSGTIMDAPVLNMCGHLFDSSQIQNRDRCPIDQTPINNCIPFSELQKTIEAWKSTQTLSYDRAQPERSLSASTRPSLIEPPKSYLQASSQAGQDKGKNKPSLATSMGSLRIGPSSSNVSNIQPIKVVENAHEDDIHGFISVSSDSFVSGSKDTSLKMWGTNGELKQSLISNAAGYKYWVTALSKMSHGYWASGTRDGYITLWSQNGAQVLETQYKPSRGAKDQYICKDRNKTRINCITELECTQDTHTFYTGTPRFVQLWDGMKGRMIRYYQASDNDWVYCIEVLEDNRLVVVIGSDLELWNMKYQNPEKSSVIKESKAERVGFKRPHISAISRMEHNPNLLSAALFNGYVRIVDMQARSVVKNYQEHKERVWSTINLRPHIIASSADDKTIKIWDIRQKTSICTIAGQPGRVSSLLKIDDNTFISGSCPDKVFESASKASITFWDIRKILN